MSAAPTLRAFIDQADTGPQPWRIEVNGIKLLDAIHPYLERKFADHQQALRAGDLELMRQAVAKATA